MSIKRSHRDLVVDLQCVGYLHLKFASRKILMLLSLMGQTVLGWGGGQGSFGLCDCGFELVSELNPFGGYS